MVVRQLHPECDLPIYKLNIIICECIIPINFYTCVVHTCDGSTLWHISSCHLISRKVINVISFNSLALLSSIFFAPTIASHLASSSVVQLELAGSSYTEFPFHPVYLIAHVDSFSLNKPSLLSSIIKHTDREQKMLRPLFTKRTLRLTTFSLFQFNQQVHHSGFPYITSFIKPIYILVISLIFSLSFTERVAQQEQEGDGVNSQRMECSQGSW